MLNIPRIAIKDEHYRWFALAATMIGCFMSVLDTTVVNIAVPKMMSAFAVDTKDAQWILTAYMLAMGVLQPTSGYLCDTFGARRMYLLSLFIFILGSALCGIAWSNNTMIIFRIIQALGGGLIIPIGMSILLQEFSANERNTAMGIFGLAITVAPAIGPTLSGYLVDYWDWRYIFTINIPIGIVGYIVAALVLRETKIIGGKKFDFSGFICCSIGLFCLLLALSKGVDEGWDSAYILSLLYISFATLVLFVLIELHSDEPLLDLSLFKDWNFALGNVITFICFAIMMGGMFLVPLFLENILGNTAMQSGILLLPAALSSTLIMLIAAKLADRFGAKPLVIVGSLFLIESTFSLMYVNMDTSYHYIMGSQIMRGVGTGLAFMTITALTMSNITGAKISRASALSSTIRQVSGSFGIAVLSTVLQNRQIYHTAHIAEDINYASPATNKMLSYGEKLFMHSGDSLGIAQKKALVLINSIVQKQSAIFSFDDAFWVLGVFAVFMLISALLLKTTKSKSKESVLILE
jgi:EmrB/QacA subfamily drug resistance transporter